MGSNHQPPNQEPQCPEPCCGQNDILCVSIPCPVQIVLLGLPLTLELPCLRLTSGAPLTGDQINEILDVLRNLLGNLGTGLQATGGTAKS